MMRRLFIVIALVVVVASLPPAHAEGNATILRTAKSDVGKKMWSGYGLSSGTLGCAAALSNVLKQAGYPQAHSAAVVQLYNQLRTIHGISKFKLAGGGDVTDADALAKQAKPGDVLLAFDEPPEKPNLGPKAHCGIVGPEGQIYTNDWNDGVWKLAEFQRYFYWYKHLYIVRLP